MPELGNPEEISEVRAWLTPSRSDVLTVKSEILTLIEVEPLEEASLLKSLAPMTPKRRREPDLVATHQDQIVGNILTAVHPLVVEVRRRNSVISAIAELKEDGIVRNAPTLTQFAVTARIGNTTGGTSAILPMTSPSGFLETSAGARGWDSKDHEAFAVGNYRIGSKARLLTADGELMLTEALQAHRAGRYMSAEFMLGAFSETVWMEAAKLSALSDPAIDRALKRNPFPLAYQVQQAALDFFGQGPAGSWWRPQLEPWVVSTVAARNVIGHANVIGNRTGSFTETSSAVRIIDTYRHVEDLEGCLQANQL